MECGVDMAGALGDVMLQVRAQMRDGAGRSSNALAVPSAADRDAFAARVVDVLGGNDQAACVLPPPYKLIRLVDPQAGPLRVVVEQPAASLFYGTYAAKLAAPRALAVEAPHPIADTDTELQATAVFVQTGARFLSVAGSHRCADREASACSGTTAVCNDDDTAPAAPFRISDAAHTEQLPFFRIHALQSDRDPKLLFLQLHGNASAACPDALVSDSSGAWSDSGAAARLGAALAARGASVGKCGMGFPVVGCDLCGTDNVEARETNGANDACTENGTSSGRFVHVEQHGALRQAPYQVMIDAVREAFK